MNKYRVTLTAEEQTELERLVSVGKGAARKLTHARILLLADTAWGSGTFRRGDRRRLARRYLHGRARPPAVGYPRTPRGPQPQSATATAGQNQDQGRR